MYKQGASVAVVAGILVVVVILIVILYNVNGGALNLGRTTGSGSSSFSIAAVLNSTSIYQGHSAPLYLTFFNPFNEPVNMNLQLSVGSPNYVAVSPSSKSLIMPASMSSSSVVLFNVSCLTSSSGVLSTYLFSSEVSNFWQNLTTSVIIYPYGINPSLIPQTIYNNSNQGFMSVSANPMTIETQIPSGALSSTLNLLLTPVYSKGAPYTQVSSSTPNDYVKSIEIIITNSSGIAAASAYYNGQIIPFSVSGSQMTLSLFNTNLLLLGSGLPLKITATNGNSASQNLVKIYINYNYYFQFSGSPSDISCA